MQRPSGAGELEGEDDGEVDGAGAGAGGDAVMQCTKGSQNEKSSLNTAFNKGVFENMDSTYYSPLDDTTGMFTETNTKFYTNCNANLVSA